MIGRLTGKIVAQEDDGTAVIDVGGVGYELTIPLGCLGRAQQDELGRVVLHVHTHATREEAMTLYGFPSAEERKVFRTVIGVPNVGPKMALSILGALTVNELAHHATTTPIARPVADGHGTGGGKAEQLRSALANLGFRPNEVDRALEGLRDRLVAAELADLVREGLSLLRR